MPDSVILTINTGSSSLKVGFYASTGGREVLLFDGLADGVGRERTPVVLRNRNGEAVRSEVQVHATHQSALRELTAWLADLAGVVPETVGHRIVHGGPQLTEHQRITPAVLTELHRCVHFAPVHIPLALALIEEAERAYGKVPQFACFDTAFHRTLPPAAAMFPLPRALFEQGIRRYGFHGLSYESIVQQFAGVLPRRVVIAHLGAGASLAAIKDGQSIDTSMGLTPTGGIPMATRSGDLDPGVLLFLLRSEGCNLDALEDMLNHDAGMAAISGGDVDMRNLLAAADAGEQHASLAIEVFCAAVAKTVASYAAVLGGLDLLVFTGGIGEHSAAIRNNVCRRIAFLGLEFEGTANGTDSAEIVSRSLNVRVCVKQSEEDLQIAHHCRRMLSDAAD